ncbi:hypothetical protein HMPREF9946_02158 [Acetobacteraceae bacterium AT-5844]|nr:hypothetical protein HMPREF9946_02158 [Acetobacteraceae bacterium AT-5844]
MSQLLRDRRAEIRRNGREMVLHRTGATPPSVTLLGFPRSYRPDELEGGVVQGDQQVETLNDELAAAGWTQPATPDRLVIDGRSTTVQGARAVYDGALLIGWSLWVRGR